MRFPPAPPGQVTCPRCGQPLATAGLAAAAEVLVEQECPRCRDRLLVQVFPAIHRAERGSGPVIAALEGEAACFFHPEKQANVVCDQCGRFLCALCDLPVGTRHVCPKCLAAGLEKEEKMPELLRKRTNWGHVSLLLGLVPLLLGGPLVFFIFVITAPAAVFFALYGWNKPCSLVHGRGRVRASIGLLLGLAEIAGLFVLGYFMWKGITNG